MSGLQMIILPQTKNKQSPGNFRLNNKKIKKSRFTEIISKWRGRVANALFIWQRWN